MSLKVVLDSDFFNHLTERDKDGKKFKQVFMELGFVPVFHEFIYENELKGFNATAEKLVEEGFIKVYYHGRDFLKDKLDEMQYDHDFRNLFSQLNAGLRYDASRYKNCFECKDHQKNLGELHSSLLARELECPYMCSDDLKAKTTLLNHINSDVYKLEIITFVEFFEKYTDLEDKKLTKGEFKEWVKHLYRSRNKDNAYIKTWERLTPKD